MTPAERERFEKCLALSRRGATAGERAAGKAAAERIAVAAGTTFAEATARTRRTRPPEQRPVYAWAQPKEPTKPVTVEEMLRQKAATAAWRRERTAAADRRRLKEQVEEEAYQAQQRELQAERDREWAASRASVRS